MSGGQPRFLTYRSGGSDHPILARGPQNGPQVLILQPFFEEMNRCRSILADVQRGLAGAGIGSALIDLPGTGESETALGGVDFAAWRQAVADAARVIDGDLHSLAVRGGCLLDAAAPFRARWRLSPIEGRRLLHELDRAARVSGRGDGLRAGYRLSTAFTDGFGRPPCPHPPTSEPSVSRAIRKMRMAVSTRRHRGASPSPPAHPRFRPPSSPM